MGKYLYLQSKRLLRYLHGVLCVVLILLGGLFAVFSVMVHSGAQSEENLKFQIGLVGSAEDEIFQMGLSALKAFDSSRFSLEIVQMEEHTASAALERGDIAAYVVIPEGFVDSAFQGRIMPLKLVSTTGAVGMVSIFKEEVTDVVSALLLEAQKGVFGMSNALRDNQATEGLQSNMDRLSIQYVELAFARDKTYSVQQLGIADELGLEGYLLCGLGVLFLLLSCLPFAPLMIRQDVALGQMLSAKGKPAFGQAACDFLAYFLNLTAMLLTVLLILYAVIAAAAPEMLKTADFWELLVRAAPVVVMAAAFSFMLYTLTTDLISGVLLQFLATLAMCFVSGCMYPVFFFPEAVQKLAAWLPTGLARAQLAGCITGNTASGTTAALLLYSGLFLAAGVFVSARRIRRGQG